MNPMRRTNRPLSPPPLESLAPGRHALITGGSSGIGFALSLHLLKMGAIVHLVGRSVPRLNEAAQRLRDLIPGRSGQTVLTHSCDVADAMQVATLFSCLGADGAMPSIVVNSAGVTHPGRFVDQDEAQFRIAMDVNYWGTVHILQHAVPWMIQQGQGQILNVSSVAGILGVYGMTSYSASKFAVRGLSLALRSELKEHGINVSVLCPPDTDTPMLREEVPLRPAETEALSPSDQAVSAETVARSTMADWSRKKAIILPGASAKIPALLARFSPGLLEWLMDRTIRQVQSRQRATGHGDAINRKTRPPQA